jgi:peptidoglycan hydrolase-like protein with peptidoglycan-binding domain
MPTIVFFDDVNVSLLPSGYDAYAGYADGIYANIAAIRARFPGAEILSIAVRASDIADILDVEPGDAVINDAPAWFKAALKAGVTRPGFYISVSGTDALVSKLEANGIPRTAYRLWTAHYGQGQHICGPATCHQSQASADATQYTDTALGKSLDESLANPGFLTLVTPPAPVPYPVLTLGDTGDPVKTLQERLNAWHANPQLIVDGNFGKATLAAVKTFQGQEHLTVDGVAGPATWTAIIKNPPVQVFAAPAGLRVTTGIISLSWDSVSAVNGVTPSGYTVNVLDAGKVAQTENVKGTTAVIDGLTRGKVYELTVSADGGQGTAGSARLAITA